MPAYDYACRKCGHRFERRFKLSAPLPKRVACPSCKSVRTHRLIAAPRLRTFDASADAADAPVDDLPKLLGRKELAEISKKTAKNAP